ncbi:tetratricopeptide repeat protein [Patescibacteria group bacterium]
MDHSAHWEEKAIKAAMEGAWEQAIDLNQKIIELDPQNLAALCRLARANWEIGRLKEAKTYYKKALKLDPYNIIANKNLKRLADQEKSQPKKEVPRKITDGTIFLEEPGLTKLVKLARLASPQTLSDYDCGNEVLLVPKKRLISVTSPNKTHLGSIPDGLSFRLLQLIKAGNQYQAFIKQIDRQNLEIIIREVKRAPRFLNSPSFGKSFPKS